MTISCEAMCCLADLWVALQGRDSDPCVCAMRLFGQVGDIKGGRFGCLVVFVTQYHQSERFSDLRVFSSDMKSGLFRFAMMFVRARLKLHFDSLGALTSGSGENIQVVRAKGMSGKERPTQGFAPSQIDITAK